MKTRDALVALLLTVLIRKLYIIIFKWKDTMEFHPKIAQSDLLWSDNDWLIIDQNVRVVAEPGIQNSRELKARQAQIYMLILSAPKNTLERTMTRQILADALATNKRAFKWAFIIGQTSPEIQEALDIEMNQHGDILQLSIQDSYANLSYKSLAGFAWLWRQFGSDLSWIIKLDDDLDVQINAVLDQLPSAGIDGQDYIYCHAIMRKMPPVRSNFSVNRKIALSTQTWPWDRYPAYCNGYIYALRPRVAMKLVLASQLTPFIPLDDIYITGVLRHRLDEPRVDLKLIQRNLGTSVIEWLLHCPFLGVGYYALWQDLAYQRGYWPWGMLKELGCIVLEQYLGLEKCDAK